MINMQDKNQLIKTELANALSHGVGILFALVASPILTVMAFQKHNAVLTFAVIFYCFSMLTTFTFSTLYHAFFEPTAKATLRIFDHISIFFLIGGTTVPFVVQFTDSPTALGFLVAQWSLIAVGIIMKVFFTGKYRLFSSLVYIGLGSMVLLLGKDFLMAMPSGSTIFVGIGGLCYLIGVIFYQNERISYNHFIWHLFVLAAAIAHYVAVFISLK